MKFPFKSVIGGALAVMSQLALAGQLGVFTSDANGFNTHTFYYDDGKEVTVIDTQFVPALTEAMVKQIKSETQSPITRVVVTHPNPDKYNGLPYLHKLGVESITSAAVSAEMPKVHAYKENFWVNTAKAFKPGTYPAFENVKTTFSGKTVLKLKSGETLSLFELKHPGVATKQVVVRVDQSGDLIVGDLLHNKAHLWLEGGLVNGKPRADLKAWSAAVGELTALSKDKPNAKVYGGRGEFVTVSAAVKEQQRYLTQADTLVRTYIEQLGDRKGELKDPKLAANHYKELERRFSARFPDYKLSYMIGYSVYGLVNSDIDSGNAL
ncbi:MBL fold metallo-hydrolase [Jeongeupia wiesaeckerbachi]|uniref:MBL fold metallo-hydrolase n=1 Tax=Jeongeupia wiesaeckerbachi TaxID=3051218 RepID=UPI003D800635